MMAHFDLMSPRPKKDGGTTWPRAVQGDASVIKAKDDRKAALSMRADLNDEIPY